MSRLRKADELLQDSEVPADSKQVDLEDDGASKRSIYSNSLTRRLLKFGVEEEGVHPIPVEERNDTKLFNVFTIWWAMSIGIIP